MGLETGTYVEDLVVTNPPGTDDKRQGDDHIRLIKTVLRNTLKRATKAFSLPGSVSKSANYSVLSSDDNLTILCNTATAFTLTLPTLTVNDAGWVVFIIKTTTDANPVFVVPPSGTINGYSKIRRSVEFVATRVMWTGSAFVATRPFADAIGSSTDFHGSSLPNGYLWADGSSFLASDYVELNSVLGGTTKPDLRGRASFGRDNMGIGAANRITASGSGIAGSTLGASGGGETTTLTTAQLPSHAHTGTTGNQSVDHTHSGTTGAGSPHQHGAFIGDDSHSHTAGNGISNGASPGAFTATPRDTSTGGFATSSATTGVKVRSTAGNAATADNQVALESAHTHPFTSGIQSASHTHAFTSDAAGSGAAHSIMPPALMVNKILVAE